MIINTHIISIIFVSTVLTGCITVKIPVGDAIDSTKDWINEERDRKKQDEAAQSQ